MPFLYQTRTLAGLRWSPPIPANKARFSQPAHRRSFHTPSRLHPELANEPVEEEHDDLRSESAYAPEDNVGPRIKKIFSGPPAEDAIGSRQRRKVKPLGIRFSISPWESQETQATRQGRDDNFGRYNEDGVEKPDSIEFEEQDQELLEFGKDISSLTATSYPHKQRESTITDSERHTFQRIFSDIFSQSQKQHGDSFKSVPNAPAAAELKAAKNQLDHILGEAIIANAVGTASTEEKQAAVNRYPPALRAAAAQAIGLITTEEQSEDIYKQTSVPSSEIERLRQPERSRVETLMRAAKTDFELWQILEDEVFSLVSKMGLEDPVREDSPKKKSTQPELIIDDELPPLTLYGPLYPSYLLLALRLLDRSFARPSPLALSILPRIKALGLISHVLGASTVFYNELLRIVWFRHDDFRSVISLLQEMEASGLDFDVETLEVIDEIISTQIIVKRGERGETLKLLWTLPEFAMGRFGSWRQKVYFAVDEKRMDAATSWSINPVQ